VWISSSSSVIFSRVALNACNDSSTECTRGAGEFLPFAAAAHFSRLGTYLDIDMQLSE